MSYWFDPDWLVPLGHLRHEAYRSAEPLPHIVLENFLPPERVDAIREAMWQFNSSLFLFFLHHLTGIRGLTGDRWLYGGGIHQVLPGRLLKIHPDFDPRGGRHNTLWKKRPGEDY